MTSPLTLVVMRAPSVNSSGVTSQGPTGVVSSQALPWVHSVVRPW